MNNSGSWPLGHYSLPCETVARFPINRAGKKSLLIINGARSQVILSAISKTILLVLGTGAYVYCKRPILQASLKNLWCPRANSPSRAYNNSWKINSSETEFIVSYLRKKSTFLNSFPAAEFMWQPMGRQFPNRCTRSTAGIGLSVGLHPANIRARPTCQPRRPTRGSA
jgi:hypothetical protein